MKWYIVRHGETTANTQQILQGQLHSELSDKGREHAERLGRYLSLARPQRIITSDLYRASDTARIAAREAGYQGEIVNDPRLREVHWGALQGKTLGQIRKLTNIHQFDYYDTHKLLKKTRMPLEEFGIELLTSIKKRRDSLIKEIQTLDVDTVVAVGHSAINAYLVEGLLYGTCGVNIKHRDDGGFFPQRHKDVSIMEFSNGELVRTTLNDPLFDPYEEPEQRDASHLNYVSSLPKESIDLILERDASHNGSWKRVENMYPHQTDAIRHLHDYEILHGINLAVYVREYRQQEKDEP